MEKKLRLPAVAGQFYPEEKRVLEEIVNRLLSEVEPPSIRGEIFGFLLPHAGYSCSGSIAAHGFKAILGKSFDTIIIIGDSHYERFDGVSIWLKGLWETPLGRVPIDEDSAGKIISASDRFFSRDSAHLWEHSIEVQLPFLQKVLKEFKILPIIFGSEDEDWQMLSKAILKSIEGKKVLIISSSDLSHYLPYEEAKAIDQQTLRAILNLNSQNLEVCARDSVKTLIEIARGLRAKTKLLKYANSGDTVGDKSQVVGYGTVAFYR